VSDRRNRLASIVLDERTVARRSAQVEHERRVAIFDLIEENSFVLVGGEPGPYGLHLGIQEARLIFDVRDEDDAPLAHFALPLGSFRRVVRDYFAVCDSYYKAIKTESPSRIEAIDMGRRGLHNEGSELLRERLAGKVEIDFDTARRLFTLLCVLHIRS
jgi:uncharacterized protein (UPF0262 family)